MKVFNSNLVDLENCPISDFQENAILAISQLLIQNEHYITAKIDEIIKSRGIDGVNSMFKDFEGHNVESFCEHDLDNLLFSAELDEGGFHLSIMSKEDEDKTIN